MIIFIPYLDLIKLRVSENISTVFSKAIPIVKKYYVKLQDIIFETECLT